MHQKALKLPHTVATEWSMKVTQEQRNCQMKSGWWAICYWLEKKKSKPNKKSYSEINQQGAKFCLALNRYATLPEHLKICSGVWGRLDCMCMRMCMCMCCSLPLALLGTKWGSREQGHHLGSMQQRDGYGGESGWQSVMTGRSQCTPSYTGAVIMLSESRVAFQFSLWHGAASLFWVVLETVLNLWKYIVLLNIPNKSHNTFMWFPHSY